MPSENGQKRPEIRERWEETGNTRIAQGGMERELVLVQYTNGRRRETNERKWV